MRTLKHREVSVNCWVSGKHWDSLIYRILIREPLGSTLAEEKGREGGRIGQRELLNCNSVLMETTVHPPMGSSEAGMTLRSCSQLYPHRGTDLYIPASVTEFLVPDF